MLAYTTDELARLFRTDVDDILQATCGDEDCLWKEVDVYRYMTQGADAVLRIVAARKRFFEVPYAAAVTQLRIPAGIQHIIGAKLANGTALGIIDATDLFNSNFVETGTPTHFFWEPDARFVRLHPIPSEAGTLGLYAQAGLSSPLVAGLPVPLNEIADQALVLMFMKARAYEKHDAETLDLDRAREFQAQFNDAVSDREVELRKFREEPPCVRMNW